MNGVAAGPRLPSTRTYPFDLGGRDLDVTIGFIAWPGLVIVVAERGRDQVLEARFRADGTLSEVTFRADSGEIGTADLRRPAVIATLRQWEAHGREAARCILAGQPEPEPEIGASGPGGALRMLAHGAPRKPRRRGASLEQLLRDVAAAYRQALDAGDPAPRLSLASQFGYSASHIGRLLVQARRPRNGQPPLLGPAPRGRAGETACESRRAA